MPAVYVNGCDLYYEDDDFADPWTPHEAVLLQHNIFGNGAELRPWVPTLARHLRLLRLDRRGSGRSSKPPPGYQYNLQDLLSDFVGFMDALGLQKVHYVGESLGGVLGVALAAAHPERVRSLVLCSAPCWIRPNVYQSFAMEGYPDGPSAVTAMGSWAWAHAFWVRDMPPKPSLANVLRAVYFAEQRAMAPPHVLASLIRMVSHRDFDITSILPKVKAPTLLLSPTKSDAAPMDEQRMMKERIPNCEQVIFEGAGHLIALTMPDRCAAEALRFIRAHQ